MVQWERHKPFKGKSKSKASKKGRIPKKVSPAIHRTLSKADRKNASRVYMLHKKALVAEKTKLNTSLAPIISVISISAKSGPPSIQLSLPDAYIRQFSHGSPFVEILNSVLLSDVLILHTLSNEPTDEWTEMVQFLIRSQGTPLSLFLVIPDTDPSPLVIEEWSSYLSGRYGGSATEYRKKIFFLPFQQLQLEKLIQNSPKNVSRTKLPGLIVESHHYDKETKTLSCVGQIRGLRPFSHLDGILFPGTSYPFYRWSIRHVRGPMSMDLSDVPSVSDCKIALSHPWTICSCKTNDTTTISNAVKPIAIGTPIGQTGSFSTSNKNASDYHAAWRFSDDDDNDDGDNEIDGGKPIPDIEHNCNLANQSTVQMNVDPEMKNDEEELISGEDDRFILTPGVSARDLLADFRPLGFFAANHQVKNDGPNHEDKESKEQFKISLFDHIELTIEDVPSEFAQKLPHLPFLFGVPIKPCLVCGNLALPTESTLILNVNPLNSVQTVPSSRLTIQIGPWLYSPPSFHFASEHKRWVESQQFVFHKLVKTPSSFLHIIGGEIPLGFPIGTPTICYFSAEYGVATDLIPSFSGQVYANKTIPLLQRVTLTGRPTKIHSRSAVVRGMFHSPEDVVYFSPIEIVTSSGRQKGAIKESLGTHGLMKVAFNRTISKQELLCMHLFRVVT